MSQAAVSGKPSQSKPSASQPAATSGAVAPATAAPVKSWAALAKTNSPIAPASAATSSADASHHSHTDSSAAKKKGNNPNASNNNNNNNHSQQNNANANNGNVQNPPGTGRIKKKKNKNGANGADGSNSSGDSSSAAANAAPNAPPALVTANSSSHSTPSSAVTSPVHVNDAQSASHPHPHHQQAKQHHPHSNGGPAPNSNPNSTPNSPAKRKKNKGGQAQNNPNNPNNPQQQQQLQGAHHPHPNNNPQAQAQQQAAAAAAAAAAAQQLAYTQQFYPPSPATMGMRAPFPSPIPLGANGLPLPEYLNSAVPILPGAFPPQAFPMTFPPPYGQPQQGGGKNRQNNNNNSFPHPNNPNFNPQMYFPNSAGSSAASTPVANGGTPANAAFRGQPYSQFFQPQYNAAAAAAAAAAAGVNPYAYPLAYQMSQMSMAPFPMAGQGGVTFPNNAAALPGQGASSSSTPVGNGNNTPLPPFPTPTATPPFEPLLATVSHSSSSAPYFSVDVECVATGPGHNDRAMGHVAVVNEFGAVVLNVYIKPSKQIVSYLPALTGLTEKDIAGGITEDEARELFRQVIPKHAVLVGQNILKDVEWLKLEEGQDFGSMLDLAGLFKVKNPKFNTNTFFSLAHEAKALLNLDQKEQHHPAVDAWLSVKLYQLYLVLQQHQSEWERAQKLLLDLPVESAFNKKNPIYDGVCMGNKKECKCGSPWFF